MGSVVSESMILGFFWAYCEDELGVLAGWDRASGNPGVRTTVYPSASVSVGAW